MLVTGELMESRRHGATLADFIFSAGYVRHFTSRILRGDPRAGTASHRGGITSRIIEISKTGRSGKTNQGQRSHAGHVAIQRLNPYAGTSSWGRAWTSFSSRVCLFLSPFQCNKVTKYRETCLMTTYRGPACYIPLPCGPAQLTREHPLLRGRTHGLESRGLA